MKTTLLALALAFVPALTSAQPNITRDNWPQNGDLLTAALCSDPVVPGPAGANQIWDMSGLLETGEGFFDFVTPTGTPWEPIFPNSNVCTVNWFDAHTYQEVSSSAWLVWGNAAGFGTGFELVTEYVDPEQFAAFPYTYGSTFSDDFSGTTQFGVVSNSFAGSVSFEADGYGTLILPTGTFQNVVRYTTHREEITGGITSVEDQWTWASADHRGILLMMESIVDDFGSEQLVWYNKAPADVTGTAATSLSRVKALY